MAYKLSTKYILNVSSDLRWVNDFSQDYVHFFGCFIKINVQMTCYTGAVHLRGHTVSENNCIFGDYTSWWWLYGGQTQGCAGLDNSQASHPLFFAHCTSTCSRRHIFRQNQTASLLWFAVGSSVQPRWERIRFWTETEEQNWNHTWNKKRTTKLQGQDTTKRQDKQTETIDVSLQYLHFIMLLCLYPAGASVYLFYQLRKNY